MVARAFLEAVVAGLGQWLLEHSWRQWLLEHAWWVIIRKQLWNQCH